MISISFLHLSGAGAFLIYLLIIFSCFLYIRQHRRCCSSRTTRCVTHRITNARSKPSVLVIVGVYTALFVSIRRTRTATPLAPNEVEIAVRFFFIVFTDCLCWMPTILLKMMSLANVYIPADLYGWLVVFVLPVNSAINPLLVFDTRHFPYNDGAA